jgi:hypothetical protein
MRKILGSLILIFIATAICSAQNVLYFPQFVDGGNPAGDTGWISAFAITNAAAIGTPAASGTITLTAENGSPLNLTLFDETGSPAGNTFQLGGGQTKFFLSPQSATNGIRAMSSGFVTITSNLPVTGGLVFIEANSRGTFATAGVAAVQAVMQQATVVVVSAGSNPDNTGVAVVNPGTSTATITFQLLGKSGTPIVPSVNRTLAANNHTAFFVSDLFPNAPPNIFGTMRIISDKPVAATSLFFEGAAFGTLPIFNVQ